MATILSSWTDGHGKVFEKIPMKRKRISPIQDALYWCRAKRDKDGFVIKFINNFIGSGVFTQKKFLKGDFLLEYGGNLLTYKEGLATEKKYKTDPSIGSFLYFFDCGGKKYCFDATYSHGKGRMINDDVGKNINCIPKVVIVDKNPRICFFAAKDLELHAELRYNYGEGLSLPWRQKAAVVANSKQSSGAVAPQFTELLRSTAVVAHNDVILRCMLNKGKPEADIKWYKGSEEIGNGPKYEIISEKNTATLVVHETKISDAAVYKCMATNPHGQVKTDCSVSVYSM
ncbi:hypothetical protein KUTeg_017915 [Tegillarca granosa]|uniref:Ig-like domain-containing protein n=1 Tax=Tegillarca granosa TaxID=220873 RepID=A0ABQ9EL68_TEGGR|nr:hypothetical protein KUTeg_017915 [Tegillarca granosa]